jgi:hypothetical protein
LDFRRQGLAIGQLLKLLPQAVTLQASVHASGSREGVGWSAKWARTAAVT